jgi:hypothetical protein
LGKEAHVWLGSANATVAAFNQNVEFLVQLSAPTKVAGVDVFMGADSDDASLMSMLTPYSLPTAAADPDADERALKHALDVATRAVYGAGLRLSVSPARDRTFTTTVTAQRLLDWPSDVIARCWSVNRDESSAVPMKIGPAQPVCLGDTEIQGLSRFLAIELTATLGRRTCTRTFSMCLPMDGAPADRAQSVLRSLLNSRERVLQYLMFLLADETTAIDLLPPGGEGGSGTETACAVREVTLFETLLKALARSPEKIDQVATLVSDLGRDAEGNSFLPEGFDLIWPAFAQARAEQHHEGKTETI